MSRLCTQPGFLEESRQLIVQLRKLTPPELSVMMGISARLGKLNHQRFSIWRTPFTKDNAKQALLAFKGDVYEGIDAGSFNHQDFKFAQTHLRILSGLYGLLKPMDLIQAYRLEMGARLKSDKGDNLYQFWGDKITGQINRDIQSTKSKYLINLASSEYFKSLNTKLIKARIISPVFKDYKNGRYKIISFYAKKARGLMSAYIVKNRLKDPEHIKDFNINGYQFWAAGSTVDSWIFRRKLA